jgi:hypothetical protein
MTEAEPTRETRQSVIHWSMIENSLRMCQFSEGVAFVRSADNLEVQRSVLQSKLQITYFSVDKAHLMYNAHLNFFDIPFDV